MPQRAFVRDRMSPSMHIKETDRVFDGFVCVAVRYKVPVRRSTLTAHHAASNKPTSFKNWTPTSGSLKRNAIVVLRGHPHVIPSPTQSSITSQLTFLCPYTNQHSDLVNSSLTTTANHSLTPSFSVCFHKQRKRPPASVLHPMSHDYQLCQPANGRADRTGGDWNKRSLFGPARFIRKE